MYLHMGQNVLVEEKRIIGIFDFEHASEGKQSMQYLQQAERESIIISACDDVPRSFVVCDHPYHKQIVYLSQLSSATLQKRMESGQFLEEAAL